MRPMYESQSDLKREEDVVKELSAHWMCDYQKLPMSYQLDYALLREGKICALCEIKVRNVVSDYYGTLIISASKRLAGLQYSKMLGVPALLVVKYEDGLRFINFSEEPDSIGVGGRTDRGDMQDTEIVFHYETGRLKDIHAS